jgi:hypothetical protein
MYQDERKLDFKPIGMAIKRAREAKGWTQEYLAQLVDLTPRSTAANMHYQALSFAGIAVICTVELIGIITAKSRLFGGALQG